MNIRNLSTLRLVVVAARCFDGRWDLHVLFRHLALQLIDYGLRASFFLQKHAVFFMTGSRLCLIRKVAVLQVPERRAYVFVAFDLVEDVLERGDLRLIALMICADIRLQILDVMVHVRKREIAQDTYVVPLDLLRSIFKLIVNFHLLKLVAGRPVRRLLF